MPIVTMPNGDQVRFPDEMPRDQISTFIEDKFPGTFTKPQEAAPKAEAPQEPQGPQNYRALDVPGAALSNIGTDIGQIAGGIAGRYGQVGLTGLAKDAAKTGIGMVQEMIPGQQQYETQYADPLYAGLSKSYGFDQPTGRAQWEQIKRQVAEHPVQTGLDVSLFASPLESVPGKVGTTARLVNPINVAGKTVSTVAKLPTKVAKYWSGEVSGLGPKAIEQAYAAGKAGGAENQAFVEQARGYGDPNHPVTVARQVIADLRQERSAGYTANMAGLKQRSRQTMQRLDIRPIEAAFANTGQIQRFVGHVAHETDPATAAVRGKIGSSIAEWKADPGAHTAEGFDALKQKIQSYGQMEPEGSPGSLLAGRVANAVKDEISKQEPGYAHAMKTYQRASNQIDELTRTFSLGKKSLYDSSLRKLQSILRNNAWTSWTARAKLAEDIASRAPTLLPSLSGQAVNTWLPRGLAGKLLTGGTPAVAALTASIMANPAVLFPFFLSMAAGSPRLVGEVAHGAGRVIGGVSKTYRAGGKHLRIPAAALPRITKTQEQ